jgi:hypothetical protein
MQGYGAVSATPLRLQDGVIDRPIKWPEYLGENEDIKGIYGETLEKKRKIP